MPEGVKTSFRQLSGINAVGAVGGTLVSVQPEPSGQNLTN
ncbi:hypothetical protein ECPA48_1432 [Escherichia coli PA48]|nr:hypothetical protein ECEC96038_5876 [Escherichia coli EC96038]EKK61928.1 hypothetical protein EC100869_5640 [Escherichia coli 10.0869]ELW02924.1 hypothetical protein ECPA48_1432 [Escherichia coli PA48]